MIDRLFALLVQNRPEVFEPLRMALRDLSVEAYSVATCQQAYDLIPQCKPQIIFTESFLVDGSWISIAEMAEVANVPLSVIVVGAVPDTRLYLSVMERGAFDFIAPPFEHEPLEFVIRSAALNTSRCRKAMAKAAMANSTGWPAASISQRQINGFPVARAKGI